jgi:hypothetical protein
MAFVTADHPARNAGSNTFSAVRVGSSALDRTALDGRRAPDATNVVATVMAGQQKQCVSVRSKGSPVSNKSRDVFVGDERISEHSCADKPNCLA